MKDEVIWNESAKSRQYIIFLVEIRLSKNYYSIFEQKSPVDLNSGSVVHPSITLDHWAMMIYDHFFW